ncbi:hypothetical protein VPHK121_0056 [Vibrio phage K121]
MITTMPIANQYGSLEIKEEGGKFYWSIEDCDGDHWQEIPVELYECLLKHKDID